MILYNTKGSHHNTKENDLHTIIIITQNFYQKEMKDILQNQKFGLWELYILNYYLEELHGMLWI